MYVTFADNGDTFIASYNHCIHVYDSSGKKMTSIGSKGIGEVQFKTPREYLSISGKLVKCWRVWQTQDPRG